jgi:cell division protein FtsI/penicillin-binding protein 2
MGIFVFAFLVLILRLFYWQIIQGKVLSAEARGQYEYRSGITAPRDNILASDGSWLSASANAWTIAASIPELEEEKKSVADKLAPLFQKASGIVDSDEETVKERAERLDKESDRIYGLLTKEKIVWTPLKSRVSDEIKVEIEKMKIKGIHYEPEEIRVYPEASSAAHILGFVGKDQS